jgi:2-oxoisovalerate dehydrogenase E1 component
MNPHNFYRSLYRIRRTEEEVAKAYPTDKIKSPVHLSIGQEAISVAVCEALRPEDIVFGTYRGHANYLAKGGNLKQMVAELYGKSSGCTKGKGGSMHLIDVSAGVMGTSAVVGTTVANAVGYAYALKVRREKRVVVSFFGDGATEEGVFAESLNFAALKSLPIIFVCENNGYAIHTHQTKRQAVPRIAARAAAAGVVSHAFENDDVLEIHSNVREAIEAARTGEAGPFFFECPTYRWREHVGPNEDWHLGFRKPEDAQRWKDHDQVRVVGAMLSDADRKQIEADVEVEVREAFEFAENSPFPELTELHTHVFAGGSSTPVPLRKAA